MKRKPPMSLDEPYSDACSNPGRDDRWTSPCCYADVLLQLANEEE